MMGSNTNRVSGRAWMLVWIIWIGYMVVNLTNFSIGIMMPDIAAELSLSLTQQGWLSASSWILKAIFSIPIALMLAKFNAKYVLQMVLTLVSIGILLQGFAQNYAMVFIGRALVFGVAGAMLAPLAVVKIKLIPKEKLSFINGVEAFTGPAGQAMGTALVPFLLATLGGWRSTLIMLGVIGAVVAILWLLLCHKEDGESESMIQARQQKIRVIEPFKEALRTRTILLLALGWWGTGLIWNATYTFWPTYAQDTLNLTLAQSGQILGLLPIGSIVGSLTAPKIADWIGYDKWMICPWGFILPFTYFGMLITPSVPLLCALSFIAGYGAYAFVPVAFTAIYKVKNITPIAVSVGLAMIYTTNGVGGALGGMLSAYLADSFGMVTALKLCCLSPFIFGILTLFLPKTGRKVEAKEAKEDNA